MKKWIFLPLKISFWLLPLVGAVIFCRWWARGNPPADPVRARPVIDGGEGIYGDELLDMGEGIFFLDRETGKVLFDPAQGERRETALISLFSPEEWEQAGGRDEPDKIFEPTPPLERKPLGSVSVCRECRTYFYSHGGKLVFSLPLIGDNGENRALTAAFDIRTGEPLASWLGTMDGLELMEGAGDGAYLCTKSQPEGFPTRFAIQRLDLGKLTMETLLPQTDRDYGYSAVTHIGEEKEGVLRIDGRDQRARPGILNTHFYYLDAPFRESFTAADLWGVWSCDPQTTIGGTGYRLLFLPDGRFAYRAEPENPAESVLFWGGDWYLAGEGGSLWMRGRDCVLAEGGVTVEMPDMMGNAGSIRIGAEPEYVALRGQEELMDEAVFFEAAEPLLLSPYAYAQGTRDNIRIGGRDFVKTRPYRGEFWTMRAYGVDFAPYAQLSEVIPYPNPPALSEADLGLHEVTFSKETFQSYRSAPEWLKPGSVRESQLIACFTFPAERNPQGVLLPIRFLDVDGDQPVWFYRVGEDGKLEETYAALFPRGYRWELLTCEGGNFVALAAPAAGARPLPENLKKLADEYERLTGIGKARTRSDPERLELLRALGKKTMERLGAEDFKLLLDAPLQEISETLGLGYRSDLENGLREGPAFFKRMEGRLAAVQKLPGLTLTFLEGEEKPESCILTSKEKERGTDALPLGYSFGELEILWGESGIEPVSFPGDEKFTPPVKTLAYERDGLCYRMLFEENEFSAEQPPFVSAIEITRDGA